jgi:hypothetical protein
MYMQPTPKEMIDEGFPYLTSSMLEAINTCPRWGLINSLHRKSFSDTARSMALEAGSAMHEIFAMLNLFQIGLAQQNYSAMADAGEKMFPGRWKGMTADIDPGADQFAKDMIETALLRCLASSEFHDNPEDARRTTSNLEAAIFELVNHWMSVGSSYNILVEDGTIGVEQSLDFIMSEYSDFKDPIRFIGLADAVYVNYDTSNLTLGEYKTASRVTSSYIDSFNTRHQVTLYLAGLAALYGEERVSKNAIITASTLPPSKTKQNVESWMVGRDSDSFLDLFNAARFAMEIIDRWGGDPTSAPMFSHSCNRYFSTCSLMPLCTCSASDRKDTFDGMYTRELSPSEEAAKVGV